MRNLLRLAVAAALLVIAASPAASVWVNPDVIKGTALFEGYPGPTHLGPRRLFAWSNEIDRAGSRIAAYVETSSGSVTRVSAKRTSGFVGGFDVGTDKLIYQQVRKNDSDLFMYDVGSAKRTPIRALNDGHWQWSPAIDTHRGTTWILYGVNRFGSPAAKWRLYLYDTSTGQSRLLEETDNRCGCLFPGTIAYPWVTWAVGEDATAWRYDIRTGERIPLLPTDRDEYSATVTPDGTTFVAQSGDRCGSSAALYRVEPDGTPFLMHSFVNGREAGNLNVDYTRRHDQLFFERRFCRSGSSDILRMRRAELVGVPARMTPSAGRETANGSTRWASTPDASPRTR
jgi:hypothetical protein